MKKLMKTVMVWCVLTAAVLCSCADPNNSPDDNNDSSSGYDMTGTYTFAKNGHECTWIFKSDGNYEVTGYGIVGTKTGKWSSKGNNVTIGYSSGSGSVSVTGEEVFTIKKDGNQLTLSLKDSSAPLSNVLVSLGIPDKSVSLTKTGSNNGNNNGNNTETYTVSFDANGGNGTVPVSIKVKSGQSIALPAGTGLSLNGYAFGGWSTTSTGTSVGAPYTVTQDITLYALWSKIVVSAFTVTFDVNGGMGMVASQTAVLGSDIRLPGGYGLSKSGYEFGGWSTTSTGPSSVGAFYTVTQDITLYAVWIPESEEPGTNIFWTVTFNTNGGVGMAPDSQTVYANSYYDYIWLPGGYGLSKSGYEFGGWNTKADGTGDNYDAYDYYTVTGNVTLYARWIFLGTVPGTSLAEKLAWIQSNAQSNTVYSLEVDANESLNSTSLSYYYVNNITIQLTGIGAERVISLFASGSLFTVGSGVTLILNNITLQGMSGNYSSVVKVNKNGALVMNEGAKITVNAGEGVNVTSGTFTMTGGEISNTGGSGAVFMGENGNFTMSGGDISGNTGLGVYVNNSILTMSDGEIFDNTRGGVYLTGDSTFIMHNGKIRNNNDTGVQMSNGTFIMNDGEITGNTAYDSGGLDYADGGGVYIVGIAYTNLPSGTFIMNGGKITDNTASRSGGGVYVTMSGIFTMRGGEIYGNTASSGGGVYLDGYVLDSIYKASFTKTGGTITGYSDGDSTSNTATAGISTNDKGHAVYIDSSPSKRRETPAGSGVNLNSNTSGLAGGWEN
jgi:uncharacterized repeat protein (TIGR02543 family)